MRSDLLQIIARWEQSRQGRGGYDGDEEQEARQEGALSPADANDDDNDLHHHSVVDRSDSRRHERHLQQRAQESSEPVRFGKKI